MVRLKYLYLVVALFAVSFVSAQNAGRQLAFDNYHRYFEEAKQTPLNVEKAKGMKHFRDLYAATPYRAHELKRGMSLPEILENLKEDGHFADLEEREKKVMAGNDQGAIGELLTDAFFRVWKIAEEFRTDRMGFSLDKKVFKKCQKAILYYGNLEVSRSNKVHRFHASCFAIPTAAVNTYFCFLKQMDKVEAGKNNDQELTDACDLLKVLGLQAWTQPLRQDDTDKNVVQIERFRKHVWWVGGNALAYRSLLPVAVMYQSVPMIELLSEVAKRGIGRTAQSVYDEAFWTEGCTADGAGWGHGMQCLIWGYPIDGTLSALGMLTSLKNTLWESKLDKDNVETLLNYIEGSNWFYYKGYPLPYLDRSTAQYNPDKRDIRSLSIAKQLLKDWSGSFDGQQQNKLNSFKKEAEMRNIKMDGYPAGLYSGTRWFFNNDDLIKKNDRYHIFVNMSSVRCDGLESASGFADAYNFYPTDGMTLFQKRGNEYTQVIGAWDVTATPGVTAREGMDKLVPVTNWSGYCSKHNFAAAATNGGENAVAGYLFEKMDASKKEGANDKRKNDPKNEVLYDVKAYKSYFMLGDYMIALGAGITNLNPQMEGTIRTTIDQTLHESDVLAMQDGKQIPVGKGVWSFLVGNKPVWVMQKGKFSYTILPEYTRNASFVYENKKTDWLGRNGANKGKKELPEQVDILRLWIDHSQTPVDDTYGYVVYAGDDMPATKLPFQVLRNDTLVQAVENNNGEIVEAVFYKEGTRLKASRGELSVSAPCAVLIDKEKLSVTDATMNPDCKEIIVNYGGKRITVTMPQGMLCGKSVTVNL